MILAGQLLLANASNDTCRVSPGFVRVEDGFIAEVVEGELPQKPDAGGPNALISPGFIDAHLHLPQFDMIGAHGMPLLKWLGEVTFPSEMKWADTEYARGMTRRVAKQLLAHGTTGICAYATAHHESSRAAIEILAEAGLRGVVGQVLMDREAPAELCFEPRRLIDEAAALSSQFPARGRLAAAITPRFAISCTEELLRGAGEVAQEHEAAIQTHLAETVNECEFVSKLFDGQSYVDVYRDMGLMNERSIFGHGIHLDADDRRTLNEQNAIVAHCPTANSFLRSGTMNRHSLVTDQVKIAIGSDIGAGYERSMVRVGRAMIEAASLLGDQYPSAADAWHLITAGNADVLGWSDSGRIREGAPADLIVIEPTIDWLNSPADPLSMLMFAWDDRWISSVLTCV